MEERFQFFFPVFSSFFFFKVYFQPSQSDIYICILELLKRNSNKDQICCFANAHNFGGIATDSVAVASLCSEEEEKK